ncbi:helix-turn-helix transcriptional regulator [Streptomyces sp. NPDC049585]|uniref:helix-turn-helix domain-containing protein n=1 Tax=Streptomyces sp. NPDC049585 TaxID=3155154 RepID=UPI0034292717
MRNGNPEPPIAWRYCGHQMKMWRTLAGVSREQLAEEAGFSVEFIKSVEQGRRRANLHLLQVTDDLCGARGLVVAAHEYLEPSRHASQYRAFFAAEAEAVSLSSYQSLYIPGLLQTEDYARALMSKAWPPVDDEIVEQRVTQRLQRQEKLHRKPLVPFHFAIYEAALRTNVGGPGVMKAQLDHLQKASELRNVCLQVLPVGRYTPSSLCGPFTLLETPTHRHIAYVEGQNTSALHSEASMVSDFIHGYGLIRTQALSAEETVEFIGKVSQEL